MGISVDTASTAHSHDSLGSQNVERPPARSWTKYLAAALLVCGLVILMVSLTVLNNNDGPKTSSNQASTVVPDNDSAALTNNLTLTKVPSTETTGTLAPELTPTVSDVPLLPNSTTTLDNTTVSLDSTNDSKGTTDEPIVSKTSWPELVGTPADTASRTISNENPQIDQVLVVAYDSFVTEDYVPTRVWLFIYPSNETVARTPVVG